MISSYGCQGKPRTPTIHEKVCPQCGEIIELFSIDTEVKCEKCGFIEDDTTYSYKEIDRKFAGTHSAEIAGNEYEKPWYKS